MMRVTHSSGEVATVDDEMEERDALQERKFTRGLEPRDDQEEEGREGMREMVLTVVQQ